MKAEANYVEQTIREAVTRIAQLQDLVRGLHGLREMGRMTAVMPLPVGSERTTSQKGTEGGKRTTSPRPSPPAERGNASSVVGVRERGNGSAAVGLPRRKGVQASGRPVANGLGGRVLAALQTLNAPFDQREVWAALPKEKAGSVRGALAYLKKKGDLVEVEKGRPGYPAKFKLAGRAGGGGNVAAPRSGALPRRKEEEQAAMLKIAPANGPELEKLQEELEEAIAKRDEHRDAGRTVLEGAEQKRVDKLIAKIKGS